MVFLRRLVSGVAIFSAPIAAYSVFRPDDFNRHAYMARIRWQALGRFRRSLIIGAEIVADYKLVFFKYRKLYDSAEYEAALSACHKRSADRILDGCLRNGGLYIKLGQGLVTMAHILPREYVTVLEVLENQALRREKYEVAQILREDLHYDLSDIFEQFNPEPIAAASLAQVYVATLKPDAIKDDKDGSATGLNIEYGRERKVAVKVQYRDLRDRFPYDIWTLETLMQLVELVQPDFGFSWVVERLKTTLIRELDFVSEAQNAERCARELSHFSFVYVPRVYWKFTSKRILTMEYIADAVKITQVNELRERHFGLADVCTKLNECFAHQLFHTGFVHADPHPGNVLVRRNPKTKATQLVLLDHGLYEYLEADKRAKLCKLYKAIVLGDECGMQQYANALGVRNWRLFAEVLVQRPINRRIGRRLPSKMTAADYEHMRRMAQDHFDEIMQVLREMPINMVLLLRNMNTVRAISRRLGNPVDRYAIMARCAIHGAHQPVVDPPSALDTVTFTTNALHLKPGKLFQRLDSALRMHLELFVFHVRIAVDRLSTLALVTYLRILSLLGQAPPNAYAGLLQIVRQTEDATVRLIG